MKHNFVEIKDSNVFKEHKMKGLFPRKSNKASDIVIRKGDVIAKFSGAKRSLVSEPFSRIAKTRSPLFSNLTYLDGDTVSQNTPFNCAHLCNDALLKNDFIHFMNNFKVLSGAKEKEQIEKLIEYLIDYSVEFVSSFVPKLGTTEQIYLKNDRKITVTISFQEETKTYVLLAMNDVKASTASKSIELFCVKNIGYYLQDFENMYGRTSRHSTFQSVLVAYFAKMHAEVQPAYLAKYKDKTTETELTKFFHRILKRLLGNYYNDYINLRIRVQLLRKFNLVDYAIRRDYYAEATIWLNFGGLFISHGTTLVFPVFRDDYKKVMSKCKSVSDGKDISKLKVDPVFVGRTDEESIKIYATLTVVIDYLQNLRHTNYIFYYEALNGVVDFMKQMESLQRNLDETCEGEFAQQIYYFWKMQMSPGINFMIAHFNFNLSFTLKTFEIELAKGIENLSENDLINEIYNLR